MTDVWGPLTAADWQTAPAMSGRTATESDVHAGRAVFYTSPAGAVHPMRLPVCAIHHDVDNGKATPVVVIQVEVAPDQIIAGVRLLEGGNMVCTLRELEIVEDPDERFFSMR